MGATSDQPDNAKGDGDTGGDIVVFPDRICVRSERQGGGPDGRLYEIELRARDASGNESDPTVPLRVMHDQAQIGPEDGLQASDCRRLEVVEVVDADDPLCTPLPQEEPASGGCVASGRQASPFAFVALLLGLMVGSRLRRRGAG